MKRDWNELQTLCYTWANSQFGDRTGNPFGVLNHLHRELIELENNPTDVEEMADVMMLTIEIAAIMGWTMTDVFDATLMKLARNKKRTWYPTDEEGVAEHVKE